MSNVRKPEGFCGETMKSDLYLLLGIKLRLFRRALKITQAAMARRFGLDLDAYKHIEEAKHAPDSEKTLILENGGFHSTPYDARTWVTREVVDLILGPHPEAA
ncbi:MAG: helix-turn-helix transcriptional regulator [Elusimicrobia bacterium]|nr:helix-turn-helix transcriptional regulator [Elusimicrobiota bacterium]